MKEHSQINTNKMFCIIRFVENNLSKIDETKQFGKFIEYLYINHVYLSKKEVIFLLNSSEKLYEIVGNYCDNLDYKNINNKIVMKFYKYYNFIKNLNLAAKIPNIDVNSKTYDEGEINGIDVYYDSLPSKILNKDEVNALCNLIEKGNIEARNKLIVYNLHLVISIAKKYIGRGVDFDDLISSGNEGLTVAAGKYDYSLGFTFATYASFWITHYIRRNIAENSRTIRVPVYLHERLTKIKVFMNKYYEQNMSFPDSYSIAEAFNLTEEQINESLILLQSIISLDYAKPENDEISDEPMINFISDPNNDIDNEEEKIFYEQIKNIIFNQSNLTEKEKEILAYGYGFIDDNKHKFNELGNKLVITGERVRQIEAKTLEKLSENRKIYK